MRSLVNLILCIALVAVAASAAKHAGNECSRKSADYIIVGGGLSGLTSALKLAQAGQCVLVVEQMKEIGGLCRNWKLGNIRDHTQSGSPIVGTDVQVSVGGSFYDIQLEPTFNWLLNVTGLSALQYPPSPFDPLLAPPPLLIPPSFVSQNPADYLVFGYLYGLGKTYPVLKLAPPDVQALQATPIEAFMAFSPTFSALPANATAKQMIRDWSYLNVGQDLDKIDTWTLARSIADTMPAGFPYGALTGTVYQLIGGTGQVTAVLYNMLKAMGVQFRLGTRVNKIDSRIRSKPILVKGRERRGRVAMHARKRVIVAAYARNAANINYLPKLSTSTLNLMKGINNFENVDYQVFAFFKYPWWFTPPVQNFRSPVIIPSYELYQSWQANPLAPGLMGYSSAVPPLYASEPAAQAWGVLRLYVSAKDFKATPATLRAEVIAFLNFIGITSVSINDLMDVKVFDWGTLSHATGHPWFTPGVISSNPENSYLQAYGGFEGRIVFSSSMASPNWFSWLEGAAYSGANAADIAMSPF